VYVDVRSYGQVTARLTTAGVISTTNPPPIGDIWLNAAPTPSNISDFTADTSVNVTPSSGVFTGVFGGGSGKITAGTFDPVYSINGEKFATYLSGMTGVKEETTGVARLTARCTNNAVRCTEKDMQYAYTIDFNSVGKGSDLWLFAKTTALKKNFANLITLLTPNFDGKVWYEKDASANRLTIYASPSSVISHKLSVLEVSYRLTAPRFDTAKWTNESKDNVDGLMVPEE